MTTKTKPVFKLTKVEIENVATNAAIPFDQVSDKLVEAAQTILDTLQKKGAIFTFSVLERYAIRYLIRNGYVDQKGQTKLVNWMKRDEAVFKSMPDILVHNATCEKRVSLINATEEYLSKTEEYKKLVKEALKTIYRWIQQEEDPVITTPADFALKAALDTTLTKIKDKGIRKAKECLAARMKFMLRVVDPKKVKFETSNKEN